MSDIATAPSHTDPEPTAIEPKRVLVLSEHEQRLLLEALRIVQTDPEATAWAGSDLRGLHNRIAHGDEYFDARDELDRVTLRKRRLEEEVRRANRRIADLDEIVADQMLEQRETSVRQADTGSLLLLQRQIWAKVRRAGDKVTNEEKAAAGAALQRAGLGHFITPGFNTNSVSAYFRERVNTYLDEQQSLPVEQRVPRPVQSFLPPELEEFFELTDKPTISVRT